MHSQKRFLIINRRGTPLPNKTWFYSVTPNIPVLLIRADFDMAVANSLGLRIANIMQSSLDPFGGMIARGENREPIEVLNDSAINLIWKYINYTDDENEATLLEAFKEMNCNGVTTVIDPLAWKFQFEILDRVKTNGN
jgi:predicted amidohydrolase YtcJ